MNPFKEYNKISKIGGYGKLFYGAVYIMLASTAMASYMIRHYYVYGQWAMDGVLQSIMKSIRTPWLDAIFKGITATGETLPVIAATLFIITALVFHKKMKEAAILACYMLGVWRLNEFLKVLFHRPRPAASMHLVEIGHYSQANSYSLPSGHSMNLMALVLLSIYLVWIFVKNKKLNTSLTALLLAYGLLTGISRVYLNVHYFSDVITGWSISAACASAIIMMHQYICSKQKASIY
jgi:undecaprenyl-diphosphatase